jgi:hypothetical protein
MPVEVTWLEPEGHPVVAFEPSASPNREIEGN